MNEELRKGRKVYVLSQEGQEVVGESGIITAVNGSLYYVSSSRKAAEQGMWLRADQVSLDEPAPVEPAEPAEPEAEAEQE